MDHNDGLANHHVLPLLNSFVMYSLQSVLCAGFSLCYVHFAVASLVAALRAFLASLGREAQAQDHPQSTISVTKMIWTRCLSLKSSHLKYKFALLEEKAVKASIIRYGIISPLPYNAQSGGRSPNAQSPLCALACLMCGLLACVICGL